CICKFRPHMVHNPWQARTYAHFLHAYSNHRWPNPVCDFLWPPVPLTFDFFAVREDFLALPKVALFRAQVAFFCSVKAKRRNFGAGDLSSVWLRPKVALWKLISHRQ